MCESLFLIGAERNTGQGILEVGVGDVRVEDLGRRCRKNVLEAKVGVPGREILEAGIEGTRAGEPGRQGRGSQGRHPENRDRGGRGR